MLTRDLAKDNILVSTVCIGLIKSGQTERRYTRAKESNPGLTLKGFWGQAAKERNIPLDRVGEAQEARDVITSPASWSTSTVGPRRWSSAQTGPWAARSIHANRPYGTHGRRSRPVRRGLGGGTKY